MKEKAVNSTGTTKETIQKQELLKLPLIMFKKNFSVKPKTLGYFSHGFGCEDVPSSLRVFRV